MLGFSVRSAEGKVVRSARVGIVGIVGVVGVVGVVRSQQQIGRRHIDRLQHGN
jgi:hypothetical protein